MTGFCQDCGKPLRANGKCPNECGIDGVGRSLVPHYGGQDIGPLPKASTSRRLFGSGIEYAIYGLLAIVIMVLNSLSIGLLGPVSLVLLALIVARDCNAGAFSIGKRVSGMRVVQWRTGLPASNAQALLRNSNYLVLMVLDTVLGWLSLLWTFCFFTFIALDLAMILANPRGRRLGDFLAGTQVIGERS